VNRITISLCRAQLSSLTPLSPASPPLQSFLVHSSTSKTQSIPLLGYNERMDEYFIYQNKYNTVKTVRAELCRLGGKAQKEGCYQFCCLVNRGTMGVDSLPKTVTRQRRGCDLNPGPSAPESSRLTTRLPSHPGGDWGPISPGKGAILADIAGQL